VIGMGLSWLAMLAATVGWLSPVPAAIVQEVIDVVVIANALRALQPAGRPLHKAISVEAGVVLRHDHVLFSRILDQLQKIADALDDATPETAAALIVEA